MAVIKRTVTFSIFSKVSGISLSELKSNIDSLIATYGSDSVVEVTSSNNLPDITLEYEQPTY